MESEIKNLIEATLNIPCFLEGDSILFPGATVSVISDTAGLHGDGKGVGFIHEIVVDLWYADRSTRDTATISLVNALKNTSYTTPDVSRYFDPVAKKFRSNIRFQKGD